MYMCVFLVGHVCILYRLATDYEIHVGKEKKYECFFLFTHVSFFKSTYTNEYYLKVLKIFQFM